MDSEDKEDRPSNCEVCGVNAAKYTCPKCELRTCSVKCVNIHKKELECDGSRNRTKFVSLRKFTNIDFLSDYRLLEEITRSVETIKKDKSKHLSAHNDVIPRHLYKMKMALLNRTTKIRFLPKNFDRRKRNSSYLDFKTGEVFWHIEWRFPNADNLKLEDEKCSEMLKLSSILDKYLSGELESGINERLQFYQAVGLNGVALYIKAEEKPGEKFYRLDPNLDLRDNFRLRTIIEYPVVHVVLKDHSEMFDVIDSDDEDSITNIRNDGNKVLAQILSAAQKEEISSENLLFALPFANEPMSEGE